jgi:hypothetical protein
MIFLDVYAKPWAMHHVVYYQGSSREYTSCCVPFHKILESRHHQDYFPHNDSVIRQVSPLIHRSSSTKENGQPAVGDCNILDKPLIFKTKTKELSPFHQGYFLQPPTQDRQDEDCAAYRILRQRGDVRTGFLGTDTASGAGTILAS